MGSVVGKVKKKDIYEWRNGCNKKGRVKGEERGLTVMV